MNIGSNKRAFAVTQAAALRPHDIYDRCIHKHTHAPICTEYRHMMQTSKKCHLGALRTMHWLLSQSANFILFFNFCSVSRQSIDLHMCACVYGWKHRSLCRVIVVIAVWYQCAETHMHLYIVSLVASLILYLALSLSRLIAVCVILTPSFIPTLRIWLRLFICFRYFLFSLLFSLVLFFGFCLHCSVSVSTRVALFSPFHFLCVCCSIFQTLFSAFTFLLLTHFSFKAWSVRHTIFIVVSSFKQFYRFMVIMRWWRLIVESNFIRTRVELRELDDAKN